MPLFDLLNPIDRDELRAQVRETQPVRNFAIDSFLRPEFAEEVRREFPPFQQALAQGKSFSAVNERGKVQMTDSTMFGPATSRLHQLLASQEFRDLM